MEWLLLASLAVLGSVVVFLGSTVAFDVVHVSLHRMAGSRWRFVRALGALHETHHRFLDRELVVHGALEGANLRRHVVPEFLTQAAFSAALLLVLPPLVVLPAFAAQLGVFLIIVRAHGRDVNHRGVEALRAHRPHFFCLPEYHAWHHAHPEAHFSSWIKLLDVLLATGVSLAGRRIVLTGAETAFGAALLAALAERGWRPEECHPDAPPPALEARLAAVDVLVLAHAPADFERWVEAFCAATAGRKLPPEVWVLDPGPGRRGRAWRYLRDPRVIYRHLALVESTPPGRAARTVLDFALRGFHFVPALRSPAAVGALRELRRASVAAPAGATGG